MADLWEALCAELDADPADWSFWVQWYKDALEGNPPDWGLLAKIATQEDAFWNGSAAEVNGRIAAIVERHNAAEAASVELFNATIFDFTFDRLEGVMRAVPLPQDWRHLDDPVLLARFLEDAEDLREGIERLCKALKAEGGGVQGAGAVGSYLDDVLSELDRAHDHRSLRVGTLNELGRHSGSGEYGWNGPCWSSAALGEALKVNVEKLKELLRNHYSSTLARFALRDIAWWKMPSLGWCCEGSERLSPR